MNKTKHKDFSCPVLHGIARIQITERYFTADELPQPILDRVEFTNCANKMQCGIGFYRTPQLVEFKWECCPAHPAYDPSEPLPSPG